MSLNDSKTKIQANFQTLSNAASSLNAASDELTKVVGRLDEALKKLNVGLTDWVIFEDRSDELNPDRYDCDQIGYCKVNGKWGIGLRHIWGHEGYGEHNVDGPWLFNDAPREKRLGSVDKISELIESLSKKTSHTTKKIQEKTKEVSELALAIEDATKPKTSRIAEQFRSAAAQKAATAPTGKLGDMLVPDASEGEK